MAIYSLVNYTPVNNADVFYRLKTVLSSSGWIVVSSSNGVTAAQGDIWTSYEAVTSSYSWCQIKDPSYPRYFTFQKGSDGNHDNWRNKYLGSGSYNMNGTATTVPTYVSGTNLLGEWVSDGGGGDQDSPTFEQVLYYVYCKRLNVVADSSTRSWWIGVFDTLPNAYGSMQLGFDSLIGSVPGDPDPAVVWHRPYRAGRIFDKDSISHVGYSPAVGWFSGSGGPPGLVRVPVQYFRDDHGNTYDNMTVSTITGKYDALPVIYCRHASDRSVDGGNVTGYKGISTLAYWVVNQGGTRGTTYDLTGPKSHIDMCAGYAGQRYMVPWDGSSNYIP